MLWDSGVDTGLYIWKPNATIGEQVLYANGHKIDVVVVLGPDEVQHNTVLLKDISAIKISRIDIIDRDEYRRLRKRDKLPYRRVRCAKRLRK
jgi:histidyl-tRNA synthetase